MGITFGSGYPCFGGSSPPVVLYSAWPDDYTDGWPLTPNVYIAPPFIPNQSYVPWQNCNIPFNANVRRVYACICGWYSGTSVGINLVQNGNILYNVQVTTTGTGFFSTPIMSGVLVNQGDTLEFYIQDYDQLEGNISAFQLGIELEVLS